MKSFRLWFTACFVWMPLVLVFFIDPGNQAQNVQHLSILALCLLAACGTCLVSYFIVGLTQPKYFDFAFSSTIQTQRDLSQMVVALAFGVIEIIYAWMGFRFK